MTKQEIIDKIMVPIVSKGFQAYFVGGCVRDQIMSLVPHDFDICTDATPDELHKIFKHFSTQNSEIFGVTMPIIDGELVEIATMRRDITKGRHPKIEFTRDMKEDAERRDFTCNALYEDAQGTVYDPVGTGIKDIKANELRFVGRAIDRISEDPLRLFRFCRFQAQKSFSGAKTFEENIDEIQKLITSAGGAKEFFKDVSKERMLKELTGTFGGKYFMKKTDRSFEHMIAFKITEVLGMQKVIEGLAATTQNPVWHAEGSVFIHTRMTMEAMADILTDEDEHERFLMQMAAFLHDIGKPICAAKKEKKNPEDTFYKMKEHDILGAPVAFDFCKSIGMANKDCEVIRNLTEHHMQMHRFTESKSRYKVMTLLHNKDFDRLVKLCKADERGCIKTQPDEWPKIDDALRMPQFAEMLRTPMPEPIITGQDLLDAGCKPGPAFKKALEVAYKVQVDGHETRKTAILNNAIALVKRTK